MKVREKSSGVQKRIRVAELRRAAATKEAALPPTAAAADKPAVAREIVPAATNSSVPFDQKNAVYRLDARPGTPREILNDPAFLNNVGERWRPGDTVKYHGEDARGPYYGEGVVIQAGKGRRPVVAMLHLIDLPRMDAEAMPGVPDGYEIRYNKASDSWYAYRVRDDVRMTPDPGRETFEACRRELVDHATFRTA